MLVGGGVDVDARDQVSGKTALHLAVERQLEEMVTFLVREARVDIAREDFNGVTPVEASEKYNSPAVLGLLQRHQTSPNCRKN